MRKREKRRLAAMSNAGRRVKLDLFAEPSGDLGGSHEEAEENVDSENDGRLPKSPSSSGEQPQNPLMLLGQYSDDELDEEAAQPIHHIISSADHNDQENKADGHEADDREVNAAQLVNKVDNERNSSSPENLDDNVECRPSDVGEIMQVVGDVISGWKIVTHEKNCYYWNVETGETSWEVPDVLKVVESGLTNEQKTHHLSEYLKLDDPSSTIDTTNEGSRNEVLKTSGHDASSNEFNTNGHADYMLSQEPSSFGNYQQSNDVFTGGETLNRTSSECIHNEDKANETDCCSSVVKYGEYLLERLKSLEGSKGHLEGQGWISNYVLEVEIRVSDCRSLLLYGSSLLPFWEHSERKLRKLEDEVNGKICKLSESTEEINEYKAQQDAANANCVAEGNNEEVNRDELSPKPRPEGGEDVDMDVDMEVDDELPANNTSSLEEEEKEKEEDRDFIPSEPPPVCQPYPPPPLDEEWIPPPPPDDDEQGPPPPPPDEPQPEHYGYYGLPNDTTFYGQVEEESQVAAPYLYPSLCYETVSNTYPPINLIVDPLVYYNNNLQDPKVPHLAVSSGSVGYGTIASDQIGFAIPPTEVSSCSLPMASIEVASTIQAPAMISLKETIPVASTDVIGSGVPPAATTATTKVQSKATRSKKRTIAVASTFMANKKVSNLVNKWKAAKEEMHEDEEDDEPEDALEALEKKKQKEIEQWRAHQIASGEAKDNANFQPLGGDWRERVKRRRAQLSKQKTPPKASADEQQQQQPDLIKLSRDLPTGWQAYYDETSKKVYYGNAVTSDTTWDRPSK